MKARELRVIKELTKNMKDFLGKEFPTPKGGVLRVESILGKEDFSGGANIYLLSCSLCSRDKELWGVGSIYSHKGNLLNGRIPCGCSKKPIFTQKQWKIIINRRCKEEGYTLLSFEGEVIGNKTKLTLKNNGTGREWSTTTVSSFVRGATDLVEANKFRGWYRRYSDKELTNLLYSKYEYPYGTTFNRHQGTTVKVHCPTCYEDEYTKNDSESGVFYSTVQNLISGKVPCRCSPVYRYSVEDKKLQAKKSVDVQGGVFKSLNITDTRAEKIHWVCENGHNISTPLLSLRNGHGCSKCKSFGFNTEKAGFFYIVRWFGYGESYIKYGITNREVLVRVREQTRNAHLDYEILNTYYFKIGQTALNIENKIKRIFGKEGVCPKKWLPDGYTETITDTQGNIDFLKSVCKISK